MGKVVLIDAGHGIDTAGKRSPDGKFLEWKFNREIAAEVATRLRAMGIRTFLIVKSDNDTSLPERVRLINQHCETFGKENCCLVSIHANAAPGEGWQNARGWSAYTSKGQTGGDKLADCLYKAAEAEFEGHKIRKDFSDGDPDFEENFYILKKSACAACLTENFFFNNMDDCRFLLSDDGKESIVRAHVHGIMLYLGHS